MKKIKNLLTILLAVIIVCNTSMTAFASTTSTPNTASETNSNVVVTDTGIYVNCTYYSQEQFIELLDTAQKIETPQTYSTIALVAGTWMIPGVGEVVITAAGTVIIAGAIVTAGSWAYNAVVDWFATRAFNKSAEDAVNNCNSNKQNHIMNPKHNWNKFKKNPKWSDISPILIKVLKDGHETWEKNDQYIRTLVYKGKTVVVRFIKNSDGLVKYISTAWCN